MTTLADCNPGDLVVIDWPAADWDVTLAGTRQLVEIGAICGGKKKKTEPHTALVTLYDWETLAPRPAPNWRGISPTLLVLDVVERKHGRSDDAGAADGYDVSDPLQGRRR